MRRGWFPGCAGGAFPAAQGGRLPRGQRGPVRGSALRGPLCQSPRNTPFFRCLKWVAGLPRNGPLPFGPFFIRYPSPGALPMGLRELTRSATGWISLRAAQSPRRFSFAYIFERYFPHLCNEVKYTIF